MVGATREDHYGAAEVKDVARAFDLDELAIRDLLAEDRRAKFETVGQARLVITNAAVLDRDRVRLSAVPSQSLRLIARLSAWSNPTRVFSPRNCSRVMRRS